MSAPSDGARADARKRLAESIGRLEGRDDAAAELRAAGRALLNLRVAAALGKPTLASEAHAWDRLALALDAAEDAAR